MMMIHLPIQRQHRQKLDTVYRMWNFPGNNPFPYASSMGAGKILKDPERFEWECIVAKATPVRGWRKWKRFIWKILTLRGLLIAGYSYFSSIVMTMIAVLLSRTWGEFLQRHAEALFGDGTAEQPDTWQEFTYAVAVTAFCCIVPVMAYGIDFFYHHYCIPMYRRLRREAFRNLILQRAEHDSYTLSYEWEYNSEDDEPLEAYKYFAQNEVMNMERTLVARNRDISTVTNRVCEDDITLQEALADDVIDKKIRDIVSAPSDTNVVQLKHYDALSELALVKLEREKYNKSRQGLSGFGHRMVQVLTWKDRPTLMRRRKEP